MPEEKVYGCDLCQQHQTELGVLMDIKDSVEKNFPKYSMFVRGFIIMQWFIQYKLDERTRLIQSFKGASTPKYTYNKGR